MTLFTTNYANLENNDNKPVPEGVYEVIIEDTHPDATPGGTECISMNLRIEKTLTKPCPKQTGNNINAGVLWKFGKGKKPTRYVPPN